MSDNVINERMADGYDPPSASMDPAANKTSSDDAFQRGVDEGSAAGWWDAAVRAEMEVETLIATDAGSNFVAGARHIADDLKETEHSAEGYKKFREDIAKVAAADAVRAIRTVLADRERELLDLKGPCGNVECVLHYAHSGPCDIRTPRS